MRHLLSLSLSYAARAAVLDARGHVWPWQALVPKAYWPLITDSNSPLRDVFPASFKTDLNGKKNEWEAVVLIPFIDQERLLAAMAPRNAYLTEEEKSRNGACGRAHGGAPLAGAATNGATVAPPDLD